MTKNWVDDIAKMHEHFGVDDWISNNIFSPDPARPGVIMGALPQLLSQFLAFRVRFLVEELGELGDAIVAKDSEETVDALIDLCVIAIGTLDAFGVDANKAWDTVLKANMAKAIGVKPSRPNELGLPDLIKPQGWQGPDHTDNHGLFKELFENK
jgi:NTP pyrophosphatase (non-canonical NTP hydrolase)